MSKIPLKDKPWFVFTLIAVLVFLLYGKTVNYGFVLDDDVVIAQNKYVQEGLKGFDDILSHGYLHSFNGASSSYRPLPLLIFAFEKEFFGEHIVLWRIVHLLLYTLSVFLLWILLKQWFPSSDRRILTGILLLFITHPIHTEVIANLKSMDEILAFTFLMSLFITLTKYIFYRSTKWILFSTLFMFLALLSKEIALSFIVLIPLTVFVIHKKTPKEAFLLTIPYAGSVVLYFLLRFWFLDNPLDTGGFSILNNALSAVDSFPDRLASSAYLIVLYIYKLFWPVDLSWDYSFPVITAVSWNSPTGVISILFNTIFLGWGIWKLASRNIFSWVILSFYVSIAIVLNFFVLIGSNFAERFLFTPSLFFVIAVVFLFEKLSRLTYFKTYSLKINLILLLTAIVFSILTFRRVSDWKDNESLFMSSLETYPESTRIQASVGSIYRIKAEQTAPSPRQLQLYKSAVFHYREAIKQLPSNYDAWYNLGVVYQNRGQVYAAEEAFLKVLEYDSAFVNAYNNLAVLRFNEKNYEKAEEWLNKGLKYNPNHAEILGNLGAIYHNRGQYVKAREYYERSLQVNPNQPNILKNKRMLPEI